MGETTYKEVTYDVPKPEFEALARLLYEALNPVVIYSGAESDHRVKALDYMWGRINSALELLLERDAETVRNVIAEVNRKREE